MVPTNGEYGREEPVDKRRPVADTMSVELGDPEPTFKKPMGLVLERLTAPDLGDPCGLEVGLAVEERFCSIR